MCVSFLREPARRQHRRWPQLDSKIFGTCGARTAHDTSIQADLDEAIRLGQRETPTFVIGRTLLMTSGASSGTDRSFGRMPRPVRGTLPPLGYSDRRKFNRFCFCASLRPRKLLTTPFASDPELA